MLIHRNTNNFGILIFYPTVLRNLQLGSFNFTVDSIKFSTEMVMSFVNKCSKEKIRYHFTSTGIVIIKR